MTVRVTVELAAVAAGGALFAATGTLEVLCAFARALAARRATRAAMPAFICSGVTATRRDRLDREKIGRAHV